MFGHFGDSTAKIIIKFPSIIFVAQLLTLRVHMRQHK